jgi:hypothetical protein
VFVSASATSDTRIGQTTSNYPQISKSKFCSETKSGFFSKIRQKLKTLGILTTMLIEKKMATYTLSQGSAVTLRISTRRLSVAKISASS